MPIAVTNWFGDEPFGVWPWAQPKLGGAQPVVLSLADGIQVDQIAALKPDLIVATNAGARRRTPTRSCRRSRRPIAQSGQDAFFEPWKDQAATIGQAVFKFDEMARSSRASTTSSPSVGKNKPQFAGKKVLLLAGHHRRRQRSRHPAGWRTDFLTQMGFGSPTTRRVSDQAFVPRDQMVSVLDAADVLIWTTESDDEQAALLADPTFAKLKATMRQPQRVHRQGSRRRHRVRVAAVLPGGGRSTATRSPKALG